MMAIFFFVTVLAYSASLKTSSSINDNLAVCDRTALENLSGLPSSPPGTAKFFFEKSKSSIEVQGFDLPVLCEGMLNDFPHIGSLSFQWGNLMKIEPGTLQRLNKLGYVSFRGNRLTTIQKGVFDPIKSLERISLGVNHISTIEEGAFSNMPNLCVIQLYGNRITTLDGNIFNGSPNIEGIYLSQNKITHIGQHSFNDLESLTNGGIRFEMDLSNNSIEHFDGRSLQNISGPIGLNLETNKISDYTNIIVNCKDKSLVNLRHNRINDIPVELLQNLVSREIDVYLQGNNLPCDIINRVTGIDRFERGQLRMNMQICFL